MDEPTLDEEAAVDERRFADDAARLERIAEQIAVLHDPRPEDPAEAAIIAELAAVCAREKGNSLCPDHTQSQGSWRLQPRRDASLTAQAQLAIQETKDQNQLDAIAKTKRPHRDEDRIHGDQGDPSVGIDASEQAGRLDET
jgi:hypothetical protein